MLVKFAVWSMTRLIAILRSALLVATSRRAGKEETAAAELAEATNCLREISFVLDMRSSQPTVAETQLIQIFETRASPRSSSKRKSAVILHKYHRPRNWLDSPEQKRLPSKAQYQKRRCHCEHPCKRVCRDRCMTGDHGSDDGR